MVDAYNEDKPEPIKFLLVLIVLLSLPLQGDVVQNNDSSNFDDLTMIFDEKGRRL